MSTIRIAVGQMCSGSCLKTNARIASKAIEKAVSANVKVLFLPEAADFISRNVEHSVQLAERTTVEFIKPLQEQIKSYYKPERRDTGIFVAIGVHEPASCESMIKKVQNNQIWISNTGEILHRYQKVHLFDVNITNGPILRESNSVDPGLKIVTPFPIGETPPMSEINIGFAICYDIRFPEMAILLRQKGADIITYPSAFTVKTGEAHWEELGKARAIDTQCYVVMAAQCGEHDIVADLSQEQKKALNIEKKRESYGLALIIGPWGEVLAKASNNRNRAEPDQEGDYYEVIVAELDPQHISDVRRDLPVFAHRRPELYQD